MKKNEKKFSRGNKKDSKLYNRYIYIYIYMYMLAELHGNNNNNNNNNNTNNNALHKNIHIYTVKLRKQVVGKICVLLQPKGQL